MTPLDQFVEAYLADRTGTAVLDWLPITSSVRFEDEVIVTRGYQDQNAKPTASMCRFSLNDSSGHFNRRNPNGKYYGSLRKGTAVRCGVTRGTDDFTGRTASSGWGGSWTNVFGSGGSLLNTDWTVGSGSAKQSVPAAPGYRASGYDVSTMVSSAEVRATITCPVMNVTGTGSLEAEILLRVDASTPFDRVVAALRFDTDETCKIQLYDLINNSKRVLADFVTIPGLSTLTNQTYRFAAAIEGGTVRAKVWLPSGPEPLDWQISGSRARVREGYVGLGWRVNTGNTNTLPLVGTWDDVSYRIYTYHGEIAQLDPAGDDVSDAKVVRVEAAGPLRRIGTGTDPLRSAMYRSRSAETRWVSVGSMTANAVGTVRTLQCTDSDAADDAVGDFFYLMDAGGNIKEDTLFTSTGQSSSGGNTTTTFSPDALLPVAVGDIAVTTRRTAAADRPIAYWPCEDGEDAGTVASGLPNGSPMVVRYAVPSFAAASGFRGSDPILQFNDAEIDGAVPDYPNTNSAWTLSFLLSMPETDDVGSGTDLVQVHNTGSAVSFDIRYSSASTGNLELLCFDPFGTLLFSSIMGFALRGSVCQLTLAFWQVSPGVIKHSVYKQEIATGAVTQITDADLTGVATLGKVRRVVGNPLGGYVNVGFGHLTLYPKAYRATELYSEANGWNNQRALHRYLRLADEEDLPFSFQIDPSGDVPTSRVGNQRSVPLLAQLTEPAETDAGLIYEPASAIALEYRSRGSMLNQTSTLNLSLATGHIQPEFTPKDDDALLRNRFTVTRQGGSSFTAQLDSGNNSVQPPPNGIGVQDDSATLSISSDSACELHARWRLHLALTDEPRFPTLRTTPAVVNAYTVERLLSIGLGNQITLSDLDTKNIYDDMDQLVLGYELRMNRFAPMLSLNVVPASPYRVFAFDGEYSRLSPEDTTEDVSVVGTALSSSATSMSVKSTSGRYLWTTDAADFPMSIRVRPSTAPEGTGEVMTLTNVTGTTSPQTFTVTRGVNGVSVSHAVDEIVELAQPNYWTLR